MPWSPLVRLALLTSHNACLSPGWVGVGTSLGNRHWSTQSHRAFHKLPVLGKKKNKNKQFKEGEGQPLQSSKVFITQLCLTVCDPKDCSPPGSSVHGILQARILEWVVIPFSRGSSQSRDRTVVSCIASRFFTTWATREAPMISRLDTETSEPLTPRLVTS